MSKIINFAKVIRRNWKKSTVLFGLVSYGVSYGIERYQTFQMMRTYCEEAKTFGEQVGPGLLKPKHITVILNPEANNKKSNVQFEKFVAPLLHLAGYRVSVFQTEKEKQAQELMEIMSNTDAVLVAGGDGTLHEVVTGLMRRPRSEEENLPLGVIPLGRTNTVARHLFGSKSSSNAQLMAEAAMAVIRETTVSLDIMKVKCTNEEKPVYAAYSFEEGAFAEVEPKVQKYWYFGGLKDKFTYFINSFKDHIPVNYSLLEYVAPCSGCSQCYVPPKVKQNSNQGGRWWSVFVPRKTDVKAAEAIPDYSKVLNEECGKHIPLDSIFSNFSVFTSSSDPNRLDSKGFLWVKMYPKDLSLLQFIKSGLKHRKSKLEDSSDICSIINAREVKVVKEEAPVKFVDAVQSSEVSNAEDQAKVVNGEEPEKVANGEYQAIVVNEEQAEVANGEVSAKIVSEEKPVKATNGELPETKQSENNERFCYIDKEKYKMSSCDITLLPKRVTVFA